MAIPEMLEIENGYTYVTEKKKVTPSKYLLNASKFYSYSAYYCSGNVPERVLSKFGHTLEINTRRILGYYGGG